MVCPTSALSVAPSRARRSGSSTTRSTCSISTASTCAAPRLDDRRRVLAQLIAGKPGGRILMSKSIASTGAELLRTACTMGLEGVVAKRASAP